MSKPILLSLLSLSAVALPAAAHAAIIDGGFETQAAAELAGSSGGYCYGGIAPSCAGIGSPWQAGEGGGFQIESNSAWPGTASPDGSYYAFIQNSGYLSQTFTADATGSFSLKWLAAGRNNSPWAGDAAYDVLLGGATIFQDATTTGQPFTARSSSVFNLVAGQSYTLTFQGITTGPDNTAFIDGIGLSAAVPEPATWAMMILGIGMIGGAMRRRQQQQPAVRFAF